MRWIAMLLLFVQGGGAQASSHLCDAAVSRASQVVGVPYPVLMAIARTETGRGVEGKPWPWSINLEGADHVFDSQLEALHFAQSARAAGRMSFDLGCFQVNYHWHGTHFTSLEQMLDPEANAIYAARFLARLYDETGDWSKAAGTYHSRTPHYAERYRRKFDAQLASLTAQTPPAAGPSRPNGFSLLMQNGGTTTAGSLVALRDR